MLGMIEINLLPQEYRVQERTPLGLFLTIVVGICTVGAIGVYEINLKKELSAKELDKQRLEAEQKRTSEEKEKVVKLEAEIAVAKKRQETIIEISQSKIMWSQKLIQFGKIMAEYPDFWIERLNLAKGSGTSGGRLTMNFIALGGDIRKAAAFQERIINDTNFWYHFEKFDAPTVRVSPGGEKGSNAKLAQYGYTGPTISFDVSIPVK
jgi:Tfp pilus assembly protein PilN